MLSTVGEEWASWSSLMLTWECLVYTLYTCTWTLVATLKHASCQSTPTVGSQGVNVQPSDWPFDGYMESKIMSMLLVKMCPLPTITSVYVGQSGSMWLNWICIHPQCHNAPTLFGHWLQVWYIQMCWRSQHYSLHLLLLGRKTCRNNEIDMQCLHLHCILKFHTFHSLDQPTPTPRLPPHRIIPHHLIALHDIPASNETATNSPLASGPVWLRYLCILGI